MSDKKHSLLHAGCTYLGSADSAHDDPVQNVSRAEAEKPCLNPRRGSARSFGPVSVGDAVPTECKQALYSSERPTHYLV